MAYQQLAYLYDQLMLDAPYDEWVAVTREIFKQSGKEEIKAVADLGCGTGKITSKLAKAGFDMIGVDYSEDMLSYAEQRASSAGLGVQWIHQDLRSLEGISGMDAVVSYCDVINYITTEEELETVFRHVANMLHEGGMFIFDVHSLYHVENHLVGETFAQVDDAISYIWFCSPGEATGDMYHDLTFFVSGDDDSYIRFDEYHHQCTFPIEVYRKLLQEAGFEIKNLYGDFSVEPESVSDSTERIFFAAEKRSGK
ncbi:class I SAM-dependent DNA methyltransferase [Lentibacillus sp. Marseille-P4043]|uniref:class I SAM-dependent DNA methyltransferase n=1 Tax=Lentibacillus sp. Marseille-P4043 TaxID=2040293 RepID=UPI000D0B5811|nr:class I SAM-dependent methyltransferase [Lentibacillus sp. Marseille-P4043]